MVGELILEKLLFKPTNIKYLTQILETQKKFPESVGQISEADHIDAIESDCVLHFTIRTDPADEFIGYCITDLSLSIMRNFEICAFVINEPDKGYGQTALIMLLEKLFSEHKAHRVWLDTMEYNQRAKHVYEKLGFTCDGYLRSTTFIDSLGAYFSQYVYSILEEEYFGRKQANFYFNLGAT
jgi:RimJ/RimL family protein N-acetyltransferase